MINKVILAIIMIIVFSFFVFPAGQQESGRSSAKDMVGSDSYVASSYLDLDSILDDYSYPYPIVQDEPLSFDVSALYSSMLAIGGKVELQVSVKTNDYDYFPERDFNYIIYIGNSDLLENTEYRQALATGIKSIFKLKPRSSRIFFYFKKDGVIKELLTQTAASSMLQEIEGQYNFKLEEKFDDYDKKAKGDLSLLLSTAPENGNPNKFF